MSAVTIPRPIVEEAVSAAFGTRAKVIEHTTETLTAPGDNFATTVVCLQVELETSQGPPDTASENTSEGVQTNLDNRVAKDSTLNCKNEPNNWRDERRADNSPSTETWTCIAKTNSKKESAFFKIFSKFAFDNEIRFYETLLPALNNELSRSKAPCLKVPDYYYSHREVDNELIIMQDLRRLGFTMGNKSKGLDSRRCIEVAKELARLHSASVLVRRNNPKHGKPTHSITETNKIASDVGKSYGVHCRDAPGKQDDIEKRSEAADSISEESYLARDGPIIDMFVGFVQTRIASALDLLSKRQDVEKEVLWLNSIKEDIPAFLRRMLVECKPEFLVLCHGDTWTNNFLFSPNLDAASIVDFQIIRPSSLATDLNYLFYTSHLGYYTSINLDKILDAYYAEFTAMMEAQGYHMPFTRKALSDEVEAKKHWGVMGGLLALTLIFSLPSHEKNESPSSINEMVTRTEKKAKNNKVEERNKAEIIDKAIKSDNEGTRAVHHSGPEGEQETSTVTGLMENSIDEHFEVPRNSTFEEKIVELLKNISQ